MYIREVPDNYDRYRIEEAMLDAIQNREKRQQLEEEYADRWEDEEW